MKRSMFYFLLLLPLFSITQASADITAGFGFSANYTLTNGSGIGYGMDANVGINQSKTLGFELLIAVQRVSLNLGTTANTGSQYFLGWLTRLNMGGALGGALRYSVGVGAAIGGGTQTLLAQAGVQVPSRYLGAVGQFRLMFPYHQLGSKDFYAALRVFYFPDPIQNQMTYSLTLGIDF